MDTKNFYTVPKHSFFFFLKPKLERKQTYSGFNVAGKRNSKVKTFHKKGPGWVCAHLARNLGSPRPHEQGLGCVFLEAGCPGQEVPEDVSHAAGGGHEDVRESELLREYFSSLIQWFFEVQLRRNCESSPAVKAFSPWPPLPMQE